MKFNHKLAQKYKTNLILQIKNAIFFKSCP